MTQIKDRLLLSAGWKRQGKLLSVSDFTVSLQQGKNKRHISAPRATSDRWAQEEDIPTELVESNSSRYCWRGRREGNICLFEWFAWCGSKSGLGKQKACQHTRAATCCYGNWSAGRWGVMGMPLTVRDDSIPPSQDNAVLWEQGGNHKRRWLSVRR